MENTTKNEYEIAKAEWMKAVAETQKALEEKNKDMFELHKENATFWYEKMLKLEDKKEA